MRTHLFRSSIIGLLILGAVSVTPSVSFADTATTTSNAQIQTLMEQIKGLQQQLMTLLQARMGGASHATSSATTTPTHQGPGACRQFVRALAFGMSGSDVRELQDDLIASGLLTGTSTGYFGQLTKQAVMRFQEQNGVGASTGVVGPLTRDVFNKRCGSGGPAGPNVTTPPRPVWNGSTTPPFPPIPGVPGDHNWQPGSTTPKDILDRLGSTTPSGGAGPIKTLLQNIMPMRGNSFANGSITAVGSQSITVQNPGGASHIVSLTSTTKINVVNAGTNPAVAEGSISSLAVGQRVIVTGTQNADGSVTATTITVVNGVQNW